ncbi:MAG TPA: rhomboid family intramembrane serine protease [Candidatus Hydrogenedentes bacterium]|nr:rhomboid family intramembrane serine protease [Candidatus Hydrogenedentota bacterium]HOL76260.1 rhomboid family intramembrane serine protease [Candidatus Hydrogenedentota bacterium]HPO86799.1 rhomboid family intramembrane serine protease [Candidatus Hydrogenedentota bacterium]
MLPIRDNVPSRTPPLAMWSIMGLTIVVFVLQLRLSDQQLARVVYLLGVVPRRYTQPGWAAHVGFPGIGLASFLTMTFLHGGWLHIISNLWTLWIFGDNVEDRMGPARFLLFYLTCGVIAGIAHVVTNPGSTVPAIGASGAIAGVLGAYFFLYPRARIICLIPIFFLPFFIEIPAFFFLLLWFFSQFFSGTLCLLTAQECGGIAWWAHVGGFLAGVFLHRLFLIRQPARRPFFIDEYGVEGAWPWAGYR